MAQEDTSNLRQLFKDRRYSEARNFEMAITNYYENYNFSQWIFCNTRLMTLLAKRDVVDSRKQIVIMLLIFFINF